MTDDRIVLPLAVTRRAQIALCEALCQHTPDRVRHCDVCLTPLLEDRDRRMADRHSRPDLISGDCLDPVKHRACSGCGCACHLSRRTP